MSGHLLREARPSDLEPLLDLAEAVGVGLTTLPSRPDYIAARISRSAASFAAEVARPGAEEYLFVLEDLEDGTVAAASALVARVGGFDPFYTYELVDERVVHAPLGIDRSNRVLHVKRDHKGPTELCSLVVDPRRRGGGLGRLASLGRLLYVAARPERFERRCIAEMRGYQDDDGSSPFWRSVGHHFLAPLDFPEADVLTGLGEKDFVADLMPRHPIYVSLLPEDVQAVIGRPHRQAEPAVRILEAEGFAPSAEVDIFDAGPILAAETARIRTVAAARAVAVAELAPGGDEALVAALGVGFRAAVGGARILADGRLAADPALARRLGLGVGDTAVVAPLPPRG